MRIGALLAVLTVTGAAAASETNRPFFHPPTARPGTVWANGRTVGSYSAYGNGGWLYRENGRTVATFTPSPGGAVTVWKDGRSVGHYAVTADGGWTYWENGRTVARFTPFPGGGGTVWQDGRTVGSYRPLPNGGWIYSANGRTVATFAPTGPPPASAPKPGEQRDKPAAAAR